MCSADIFLGVLAVIFPPLPVWVKRGICSADSLINILLCVLGFIPGLLHAWYIIAKFPEPPYEYEAVENDSEGGRVRYVYVRQPCNHPQNGPNGGMNYGTNATQGQAGQQAGVTGSGSNGVPPSYAEVVAGAGDHKIQTNE